MLRRRTLSLLPRTKAYHKHTHKKYSRKLAFNPKDGDEDYVMVLIPSIMLV